MMPQSDFGICDRINHLMNEKCLTAAPDFCKYEKPIRYILLTDIIALLIMCIFITSIIYVVFIIVNINLQIATKIYYILQKSTSKFRYFSRTIVL